LTRTQPTGRARRRLDNTLFTAALASVLILFLAGVAMVLLSNVGFLVGAEAGGKRGFWAILAAEVRNPESQFALKLSLVTAGVTMLLSMVIGIPAAYLLSRHRLPGSGLIDTVLDLPIVLPPPVMGISLLILFDTSLGRMIERATGEWVYTTRGIVLAQFFIACSFGTRAIKASFDTIGRRHEEVARTLGCTRRQAFFRVVLPMARNGIVAGAIMTWARAMAEFGPILFFCGATRWKTEVMPIAIWLDFSAGKLESAIALVLIMILISTVTLVTFKRLGGQGYLW
jgi:molybdate transport system permease protein